MKTIAFLGVGIMGRGIVKNLEKTDCQIRIYSRNPDKLVDLQSKKISIGKSWEDTIEGADFTILCLTEDFTVREALEKSHYWEKGRGFLLDFGTSSPELTEELRQLSQKKGIRFLDSPMTGSKNAARDGQILYIVGCDSESDFEECAFIWKSTGKNVVRCGSVGMGQKTKIALNLVQAGVLQMYMEGMMLAEKTGVSRKTLLEVISGSAAKSGISDFKGNCILERDFSTHFSLKNMNKDVNHALKMAMESHASLPLSFVLKSIFDAGMTRGYGEDDFCSLIQINEEQNGLK